MDTIEFDEPTPGRPGFWICSASLWRWTWCAEGTSAVDARNRTEALALRSLAQIASEGPPPGDFDVNSEIKQAQWALARYAITKGYDDLCPYPLEPTNITI